LSYGKQCFVYRELGMTSSAGSIMILRLALQFANRWRHAVLSSVRSRMNASSAYWNKSLLVSHMTCITWPVSVGYSCHVWN